MTYPVVEEIAQVIESRLEAVTTGNGYTVTLDVKRPTRTDQEFSPQDALCILAQSPEATRDEANDIDGTKPAVAWWQDFIVTIVVSPSESDTTSLDEMANFYAADAETGITLDGSADWVTFGGKALTTRQTGRDINCDGQLGTVQLVYSVLYRTDEDDPYQVR